VFRDVFADIGDEQSVAQSLSTFSGHLRSIVRIVDGAGPGCLVLLDELGAGTDPTEGSALAQALLDHFIRAGALVAATTHYAELKTYAHNTPLARNASVEFDLDTLSPTYRLTIGLPGTSQAFAIAERLGLREELVSDARSRLSRAQQEFESTLVAIKERQSEVDAILERATMAEARAREAQAHAELERARARRERDDAFMAAREEAERALANIREEIRQARQLLERETLTASRLDAAADRLDEGLAALPVPGARGRGGRAADTPPVVSVPGVGGWEVGMRALTPAGFEGTLTALERGGKRATIEAGGMRLTVDVAELLSPGTPLEAAGNGSASGRTSARGGGGRRRSRRAAACRTPWRVRSRGAARVLGDARLTTAGVRGRRPRRRTGGPAVGAVQPRRARRARRRGGGAAGGLPRPCRHGGRRSPDGDPRPRLGRAPGRHPRHPREAPARPGVASR
jgi:dsDNA-specific endonuclease/ATPase MutS2